MMLLFISSKFIRNKSIYVINSYENYCHRVIEFTSQDKMLNDRSIFYFWVKNDPITQLEIIYLERVFKFL